jgi:hypothetical protein
MAKLIHDLTGQKFTRLTVIERAEADKNGNRAWVCQCECGKSITAFAHSLLHGKVKSCGCYFREVTKKASNARRKYNTYDLTGEFGKGYTLKGEEFQFDLEDYEKIKNFHWFLVHGYVKSSLEGEDKIKPLLHHLVMDLGSEVVIDHEDRNPLNNRKGNLRVATFSQNCMNRGISSRNTSGITGVSLKSKGSSFWVAQISIQCEATYLGIFRNFDDAVVARLKAERAYFGEFAPQKHLFSQYGIEENVND